MDATYKKRLYRILVALGIFAVMEACAIAGAFEFENGLWVEFACFLVPYLVAGYDVLARAWHGIVHRQPFDENLLMTIATIGAFALVFFPESEPHMAEGAAVMLFYQVGELFQDYAVDRSRGSIAEMMEIAPDHANLLHADGSTEQVDPYDVEAGARIVVKPGERVPLDGIVVEGSSQLDTSAITGESVPRAVCAGDAIVSGCINESGLLVVETTGAYEQSTVNRILELVEEASERKARTENFITRFARVYTPVVVGCAALLALVPPILLGQSWAACVQSALVFLVVSCPCALVISVPLSFFSGIGAASRRGILVKGSSYLETLAEVRTVVFDKTGTLTNGSFGIVAVHAQEGADPAALLELAAHAEAFSDHPIAASVREGFAGALDAGRVADVEERAGAGVAARVDGRRVLVGNGALMEAEAVPFSECELVGTVLHVAVDGAYVGHIVIADVVKEDAVEALAALKRAGVRRTVMLTGDAGEVASAVAARLGIDEYHAQLMPADKVARVEEMLAAAGKSGEGAGKDAGTGKSGDADAAGGAPGKRAGARAGVGKLAFVGDGINDAPVLMRADVGIAMGAMGSDAAIEAADVVLMDDEPSKIATAIAIARKTMRIVHQNIVFAIGVKVAIMVLALPFIGLANMWLAVFGDVGVACLCILNSMRALRVD